MSMEISQEKFDNPELLTEVEIWYLWTRFGKLPAGVDRPSGPPAKDSAGPVATKGVPLAEQTVPAIGTQGGIIETEEEDYEEGWNNAQRRGELARRELSIDGNKDALIARLRRSDADALEEDDYSKVG